MRTDSKHLVLEKVRQTLNILRKSSLGGSSASQRGGGDNSLIHQLKSLQQTLRHDTRDIVEPLEIITPFLTLLRAPYLSGPFKLVALDAVRTFTCSNLLSELPELTGEALACVVDAVTKCKFVQTDAFGDDLVQLQIVLTLDDVIRSPIRCYLTDTTTLDIIRSCHSVLHHTALTGSTKSSIYQAAEKTMLDASRFVFTFAALRLGEQQVPAAVVRNTGPGASCAVDVMSFFLRILQRHAVDAGKITTPSTKRHQASSGTLSALNDVSLGSDMQELLLALKAIGVAFLGDGDLDACRALIMSDQYLSTCVRNDLGRCLILLCSRRDMPLSVLQSVLGLFSFIRQLMGPAVKILVECFLRYIYVKALLQVRLVFAHHDESMRVLADSQSGASSSTPASGLSSPIGGQATGAGGISGGSGTAFSTDELEIVLESLVDLLADPSFLPSLFASFDCDPTKADVVQPLVKYLGSCKRYTLVSEPHELAAGGILEIGALIEQCYEQLVINLAYGVGSDGPNPSEESPTVDCDNVETSIRWEDVATHLRLTRLAKEVFLEGATLFSRKPQEGLRFLQAKGVLPASLTAASVATFLRIAPGLPKESAGAFLGELGKDNPSYEADGKVFHREVLLSYVQSFELRGQSVLNCLRIFLSAFRLPGEAQQIDRILVAFSEICHTSCIEGMSGLLENPEVTYLLTFSMIMLNTDLHNPNIRADRRMTTDQFVKNNTFYGKELNQTKPLPRDFLEGIYDSLANVQIRTERNDLGASMTPEMWMDLQLQASIDHEKSLMMTTGCRPATVEKLRASPDGSHPYDAASSLALALKVFRAENDVATVAFNLLGGVPTSSGHDAESTDAPRKDSLDPLVVTSAVYGIHWLVDKDLLSCIFQDIVGVVVAPFLVHRSIVAPTLASVSPPITSLSHSSELKVKLPSESGGFAQDSSSNYWRRRHATPRALRSGIEASLELLALLRFHNMTSVVDSVILMFVEFAGLSLTTDTKFSSAVLASLRLIDFVPVATVADTKAPSRGSKSPSGRLKLRSESDGEMSGVAAPLLQASDEMMELLLTSVASRAALGIVLTVFVTQPSVVGRRCWQAIWLLLAMLRDCTLLPGQMVVDDTGEGSADSDLLPPVCRVEFEMRLKAADIKALQAKQREQRGRVATAQVKKSSSLLSFQGFGEAIFGGGSTSQSDLNSEELAGSGDCSSLPVSRWDTGYEDFIAHHHQPPALRQRFNVSTTSTNAVTQGNDATPAHSESELGHISELILRGEKDTSMFMSSPTYEDKESILAAFARLKQMVESCGIAQLVPDTRLLGDESLVLFTETLIATTEAADGFLSDVDTVKYEHTADTDPTGSGPDFSTLTATAFTDALKMLSVKGASVVVAKCVSASSVSWLEMMLASVCARNRDRFTILWPLLSLHYRNTLLNAKKLTYSFERRVTGLLKITARAMVREAYTAQILDLYKLFVSPCKICSESDDGQVDPTTSRDRQLSTLRTSLLADVACQISSGMWRLLTRNVQTLTSLSLEQWQIVFDVIAVGASAGGYASIKAFETVAWLLHEPRLLANVPVFIVISIKPLLGNPRVPVSVSVGAVKLLCHLHSRLEVLISTDDEDYVDVAGAGGSSATPLAVDRDHDSDTPVLWESCWTPILRLLADAAGDSRVAVRSAASNALSRCILDRHMKAVPAGVLVNVLGDIVVPVILLLGDEMIRERDVANINSRTQSEQSSHCNLVKESGTEVAFLGEVASYGREVLLRSAEVDSNGSNVIPVIECTGSLCFVFEEQIQRLSTFPTFDKLVLRMLHVFGFFLGAPHGFELTENHADGHLNMAVTAAGDHLTSILSLLHNLGVFRQRTGLWEVTKESLSQFKHYDSSKFCTE